MTSGKQRRAAIVERRSRRAAKQVATPRVLPPPPPGSALVNVALLAPNNSYGDPAFVRRGYYEDVPFRCADCGAEQVWTATQQKWWYEVAKGYAYSTAKRCRACRRKRRGLPPE